MRRIPSYLLCLCFVSVPYANIRHRPVALKKEDLQKFDWTQTTQVLRGDRLKIIGKEERGFLPVRVLDQKIWVNGKKGCITGWINKKCLTKRRVSRNYVVQNNLRNERAVRDAVVRLAKTFLGKPYLLGGRSFHYVDCSGLVGLCYQVYGVKLLRNTVSQYIDCKKIRSNPRPGDLVFISNSGPWSSISHVLLYIGDDELIEARWSERRSVVKTTGKKRFGYDVRSLKSGNRIKIGTIYFGSVFKSN